MAVPRKRARDKDIIVISSEEDEAPPAKLRPRHKRRRREAQRDVQEAGQHLPQAANPGPVLPPLRHDDDLLPQDSEFFIIDDDGYPAMDHAPPETPPIPRTHQPLQRADSDTRSNESVPVHINPVKSAVDLCLDACTELFPRISHDYVRQLFVEHRSDIQQVTNAILESSNYPSYLKQKDEKPTTTMPAPALEDFTRPDRPPPSRLAARAVVEVLKSEFPETPTTYIKNVFRSKCKEQLYPAYLELDEVRRQTTRPYPRRRAREAGDVFGIINALEGEAASTLQGELLAARSACQKAASERTNFETCKELGNLHECSVCFDECPFNRAVACNADNPHFTCLGCTKTFIGTEIGQGTCNVTCPYGIDGKACGAAFSDSALRAIDDEPLLKKLFTLKQQQEIRDAGLGDLAECPFCEYKEVYPEVEVNFEFQCQNPDCMVLSCRRCSRQSHVPRTCQENHKDDALTKRHKIEEAMTAALVRTCNKCQNKFVKELGCNKMTCKCRNTQCYVCGKTVDYEHFDQNPHSHRAKDSTKCPLYDDLEKRHREEVEKAEKEAREAVQKEFPDIAAEDLEIKMSEAVRNRPHREPMPGAPRPGHRPPIAQDGQRPFGFDGGNDWPVPFGNPPEPFAAQLQNMAEAVAGAERAWQAFVQHVQPQFVQAPAGNNVAHLRELRRIQQMQEQMLVNRNAQPQAPAQIPVPQPELHPEPPAPRGRNIPAQLGRVARRMLAGRQMMADRVDRAEPNADEPQVRRAIRDAQIAQLEARIAARNPRRANGLAPADPAGPRAAQQALGPRERVALMAQAMQGVEVRIPPYPPVGVQGAQPRQR
ncbi:hypothetical protein MBLNU457_5526t1 [Dothideomycetes sp. NU457]